jgi:hypothetical protein
MQYDGCAFPGVWFALWVRSFMVHDLDVVLAAAAVTAAAVTAAAEHVCAVCPWSVDGAAAGLREGCALPTP